jgi:hypothetical protein
MARILIVADDVADVARQLIIVAGGVNEAHRLVTEAGEQDRPERERKHFEYANMLFFACAVRRHEASDDAALRKVATMLVQEDETGNAVENALRTLRRKLEGKTLAEFMQSQREKAGFDFEVTTKNEG